MKSTVGVLHFSGIVTKTRPPHWIVWVNGEDGVYGDVEEGAGVIGDTSRVTLERTLGRVQEAHGTRIV